VKRVTKGSISSSAGESAFAPECIANPKPSDCCLHKLRTLAGKPPAVP
jgi:hypothetical protein